jgi:hypothetical protein
MAQPWAKISGGAAPTSIEPTLLEGSIDVDRDNIPIWPAALPKFNRCPYRKSHPFGVLNLTHRDGHENPAPHVRFCPILLQNSVVSQGPFVEFDRWLCFPLSGN